MTRVQRGFYSEIKMSSLNEKTRKQVNNLFNDVLKSEKIDEHGSWEFGCDFDSKGRGASLNWDLYGVGRDVHSKRLLIVIQIRQFVRRRKNYYAEIKKSYFLIGRNEDNTAFAHPVESRVIHSAINKGVDVVRSVQNWIFGCDYLKVIRHGDLALIPVSRVSHADSADFDSKLIQDSHLLSAKEIRVYGGYLYAKNPFLTHLPGTHPDVTGDGWFKVVVGKRSDFYDFAAPTVD